MLIVVVLLFSICWAPILINNVLVAVGVLDQLHHGYLKPMREAFFVMSYLNSCVNPIVYGFMSKNFRESFKLALLSCCGRSTHAHNFGYSQCGHTSFATRTTGMHGSKTMLDRAEVDPEQVIYRAEMLKPMMDDIDRESPM